ncbi:hypothetical protein HGRIS_009790 [Hohenbuehelia grisea]|uniref:Cytochrome P450 n=1 Tax=Hohenbuehelia grisea TaxID=104357 RepID=A0ABR3J2F2_9AGAR
MLETTNLYYALASITFIAFLIDKWRDYTTPNLSSIPAVGSTGRLSSFIGAIRFATKGPEVLSEGVAKFKGELFRVPSITKWVVVVTDPKKIDDIRNARDQDLSMTEAVNESIQTRWTLGAEMVSEENAYHVQVVRSPLTRSLAGRYVDIYDEVVSSFNEYVSPKGDEWMSIPVLDTLMNVVCRTSNRLFVGLPVCRDPDYIEINTRFTIDVFLTGTMINLFPKILHPIVGPLLSPMSRYYKRAEKHLGPIIEQRMREDEEQGVDRPDRPNDLVSWLLDGAPDSERNVRMLIMRILVINFAAIHTTSNSFTQALFHLAVSPEYVQPMREEIESIIAEEGWTKAAIQKMRKVDSFVRESMRYTGVGALAMDRKVIKPDGFTFSDGTKLPRGTTLSVAVYNIHHDEEKYSSPEEFHGFRFSDIRQEEGEGIKHQLVNTNVEFLPFGHGRHACPGRFFASNEIKTMLAHVLMNYDIKMEGDGGLPPSRWFASASMPDGKARVMFRKRQT